MTTTAPKTAQLGDLIVAVFDAAAQLSRDSREITRLATKSVVHLLGRTRTTSHLALHQGE